jgi:hypothetical protein
MRSRVRGLGGAGAHGGWLRTGTAINWHLRVGGGAIPSSSSSACALAVRQSVMLSRILGIRCASGSWEFPANDGIQCGLHRVDTVPAFKPPVENPKSSGPINLDISHFFTYTVHSTPTSGILAPVRRFFRIRERFFLARAKSGLLLPASAPSITIFKPQNDVGINSAKQLHPAIWAPLTWRNPSRLSDECGALYLISGDAIEHVCLSPLGGGSICHLQYHLKWMQPWFPGLLASAQIQRRME